MGTTWLTLLFTTVVWVSGSCILHQLLKTEYMVNVFKYLGIRESARNYITLSWPLTMTAGFLWVLFILIVLIMDDRRV